MVTTTPERAEVPPPLAVPPHEVAPDVVHAPRVRQHLRAAHAGRTAARRPRALGNADSPRRRARVERRAAAHRRLHARPRRPRLRPAAPSSPPASGRRSSRRRTARRALPPLSPSPTAGTRASTSASSACRNPFPAALRLADAHLPRVAGQHLGDVEVHYHAAKGETDDHCWRLDAGARLPLHRRPHHLAGAQLRQSRRRCSAIPPSGRTRSRRMAALGAEWLFPGHGLVVQGRDAVRTVLTETARYLRVIIAQVLERMNAGETPEEIFHAVEPDPELATRPVSAGDATTIRSSSCATCCASGAAGGTATPPTCCPRPAEAQAREIAALAGGVEALVARGRAPARGGRQRARRAPGRVGDARRARADRAAQALKRDVYARRLEESRADGAGHLPRRDERRARGAGRGTAAAGGPGHPLTWDQANGDQDDHCAVATLLRRVRLGL